MKVYKVILQIFLVLSFIITSTAQAAEGEDDAQIVRFGLIDAAGSEQEIRKILHNYTRQYFEELSKQTNWKYEYVTGSLEECREKLLHGEVEFIGPVQNENLAGMIYSEGQACYGLYSIFHRVDDKFISPRAEHINSARIGVVNNEQVERYLNFCVTENKWQVEIRKFPNSAEMMNAFRAGEIDLYVDDGSNVGENEVRLVPIGEVAERFMTTENHADLMRELNSSILTAEILYPFLLYDLQEEYIYPVLQKIAPYHEDEKLFIENSPPLKIGFLPRKMPLYSVGNGTFENARGIYIDYLRLIKNESGLDFELVEVKDENELGSMLWEGKIDVAFVVYATGNYKSSVFFTNTVDEELFVAIHSREKNIPDDATIAVPHLFSGIQSYWKGKRPNWEQKFYNSIDECLEAVEKGECDVTYLPACILQRENIMVTHPSLTTDDAQNVSMPICFAVSPHQPEILRNTLNTAILHLDKKQMDMIVKKNCEPVISLSYALNTYPLPAMGAVLVLATLIILGVSAFFRNRAQAKQNKILSDKNMELATTLRALENLKMDRDIYKLEAETDKLTHLYNKVTAERICNERLQKLNPDMVAVLYVVDLDHFKEKNDTLGHQYGDRILVEFSVWLRDLFDREDCVSRFGGDEFVVFKSGKMTEEDVLLDAQKIQMLAEELDIEGDIVGITASIGVAVAPEQGKDYETLFRQADRALYHVKENGRNGYCLHPPNVIH